MDRLYNKRRQNKHFGPSDCLRNTRQELRDGGDKVLFAEMNPIYLSGNEAVYEHCTHGWGSEGLCFTIT